MLKGIYYKICIVMNFWLTKLQMKMEQIIESYALRFKIKSWASMSLSGSLVVFAIISAPKGPEGCTYISRRKICRTFAIVKGLIDPVGSGNNWNNWMVCAGRMQFNAWKNEHNNDFIHGKRCRDDENDFYNSNYLWYNGFELNRIIKRWKYL